MIKFELLLIAFEESTVFFAAAGEVLQANCLQPITKPPQKKFNQVKLVQIFATICISRFSPCDAGLKSFFCCKAKSFRRKYIF